MTTAALETPVSTMLTCQAARSLDEAHINEAQWDAFVESVGGWAYQSWNWTRVWLDHYRGKRESRIMVFHSGERLVGILPLVIDTLWIGPIRVRIAKPALCDYTLALCDPCVAPEAADAVFEKLFDRLFHVERCDVFVTGALTEQFGAIDNYRTASNAIHGSRFSRSDVAPHSTFDLPETFDEYMSSLVKNQRGNVRQDESLLDRNFEITTDVIEDPEAIGEDLEHFLRMHSEQWMRKGKLGHFNDWPDASDFARNLVALEAARGRARLYRILADGEPIAYQLAYRFGDRLHWRMPAHAAGVDWDRFGLGRVGLVKMIDSAIGEGVRSIEGGRGHYSYKIKLGADEAGLQSAVIVRPGTRSHVRAAALEHWSRAVHFFYYRLWFQRIAPRVPLPRRGLWSGWIRTRL